MFVIWRIKSCSCAIFEDDQGKMNESLLNQNGSLLVVSQFTLLGDCRKGRRPGLTRQPDRKKQQSYMSTLCNIAAKSIKSRLKQAVFQGGNAAVSLDNDGPVTILLDSRKTFEVNRKWRL